MASNEDHIRLLRFKREEKQRQVGQIETMIEEFARIVEDLDNEIAAEHRRTGIEDQMHFAYSTFAKAAVMRRDNLRVSIEDLDRQLKVAQDLLSVLSEELDEQEDRLDRMNQLRAAG